LSNFVNFMDFFVFFVVIAFVGEKPLGNFRIYLKRIVFFLGGFLNYLGGNFRMGFCFFGRFYYHPF
jgi:hypothetical protein